MNNGKEIWLSFLEEQKLLISFSFDELQLEFFKTMNFREMVGIKEFHIVYGDEELKFSFINLKGTNNPIKDERWIIHAKDNSSFMNEIWKTFSRKQIYKLSDLFELFFSSRPEFFQTATTKIIRQKNYEKKTIYTWYSNS